MGAACGMQGRDEEKHAQSFARETRTKESLGRSKRRRECNMTMVLKEIEGVRLDSSGSG
jgi:hypothetical protein